VEHEVHAGKMMLEQLAQFPESPRWFDCLGGLSRVKILNSPNLDAGEFIPDSSESSGNTGITQRAGSSHSSHV
jgi:hypothetical protein